MSDHPNIEAALTGDRSLYETGRPSKCTPEVLTSIVDYMLLGLTAAKACENVGIHIDTYHEWLKTIPEFSEACRKARNERAVKWIQDGAYNPTANANFIRFLLQCHPDTREDFKPPTETKDVKLQAEVSTKEVVEAWKQSGGTAING